MNLLQKRQARNNLQRLVEAYISTQTSLRYGSTPAQIKAAAKSMVRSGKLPYPIAMALKERIKASLEGKNGQSSTTAA